MSFIGFFIKQDNIYPITSISSFFIKQNNIDHSIKLLQIIIDCQHPISSRQVN